MRTPPRRLAIRNGSKTTSSRPSPSGARRSSTPVAPPAPHRPPTRRSIMSTRLGPRHARGRPGSRWAFRRMAPTASPRESSPASPAPPRTASTRSSRVWKSTTSPRERIDASVRRARGRARHGQDLGLNALGLKHRAGRASPPDQRGKLSTELLELAGVSAFSAGAAAVPLEAW